MVLNFFFFFLFFKEPHTKQKKTSACILQCIYDAAFAKSSGKRSSIIQASYPRSLYVARTAHVTRTGSSNIPGART